MADDEKMNGLTPEKREIVRMVEDNLKDGAGLWRQNWFAPGAPINATTRKPYRGVNNVYLTLLAMKRGYGDNRWCTYNQMKKEGWRFKDNPEGWAGISREAATIEYFELYDKTTGRPIDKSKLSGMERSEKQAFLAARTRAMKKTFKVYNVSLMEGPEKLVAPESGISERADKMIKYWSDFEAKIVFGGQDSYYTPPTDTIFVPDRSSFIDNAGFYNTVFHEMAHSTGAQSRMNRRFFPSGTYGYALEEIRVEIASLFIAQQFGVNVTQTGTKNSSAYLSSWMEALRDDPNCFFNAVYEAQEIAGYIADREKDADRHLEKCLASVHLQEGAAQMTMMSDEEVMAKSEKTAYGAREEFDALYRGKRVFADPEKDTDVFLEHLAVVTEDENQLKRIYKSSGRKAMRESELTKRVSAAVEAVEDERTFETRPKNTVVKNENDKGGM